MDNYFKKNKQNTDRYSKTKKYETKTMLMYRIILLIQSFCNYDYLLFVKIKQKNVFITELPEVSYRIILTSIHILDPR